MSSKLLALEIGHAHIKMIEVNRKLKSMQVINYSFIDTPQWCMEDGVIIKPDIIALAISKELKRKGYKAKEVIAVVQSDSIISREIVVPQTRLRKIEKEIVKHTNNYLPIKLDDYEVDIRKIREVIDDGTLKSEVSVVAVPDKIIQPLIETLDLAGLIPINITIPAECLNTLFNREKYKDKTYMVVDLGKEYLTATIYMYNSKYITKAFKYKNVLNEENIERVKHEVLDDIAQLIECFNSMCVIELPIDGLYILGGGSNSRELRNVISETFNLPLYKIEYLDTIEEKPKINMEKYEDYMMNLIGALVTVK